MNENDLTSTGSRHITRFFFLSETLCKVKFVQSEHKYNNSLCTIFFSVKCEPELY